MKEIINNINYLINEGRNNSNKINESLNSLIDKIKNPAENPVHLDILEWTCETLHDS